MKDKKESDPIVHYDPKQIGIGVCGKKVKAATNLTQYVTCKACKKLICF